MPQRYFDKFPTITYSNTEVVDITRRAAVLDRVISNPYVYFPYEISEEERADQFSYRYYKDPFRSWILYLTNKIVDPYYEWYLSQDEFNEHVIKKYGSYTDARSKIKFYRNDWSNSENLSVSGFNALTPEMQTYWVPNFGVNNRILDYSRKQVDWKTNTNKVVRYKVSSNNYIVDEVCDVVFDQYTSGRGQVLCLNIDTANTANNDLYLQHVSGDFYTSDTVQIQNNVSYVYGRESESNSLFTDVYAVANNLSEEVLSYWTPVTYYDYELERNEFNKTINILDSNFKDTIVDNLKEIMSE